jgi:subtilisin family serine protease
MKRLIFLLAIYLLFFIPSVNSIYLPESRKINTRDVLESIKTQDEILIKFKGYTADVKGVKIGITSINNLNKKYEAISINKPFKPQKLVAGTFKRSDGKKIEVPDLAKWYKIKLSKVEDLQSVIKEYQKDPNVEYVEPNIKATLFSPPNDPLFQNQWDLNNVGQGYFGVIKVPGTDPPQYQQITKYGTPGSDIHLSEALDQLTGSEQEIIVAVIDSGVDYTHPDIANNIWTNSKEIPGNGKDDDGNGYIDDIHGWDFSDDDNDPMDNIGHGTHCAGTIAATISNSLGISGINPKAKIMPLKVFDRSIEDVSAEAIRYAVDNGARVLSNSWGYGYGMKSEIIQVAINYAYAKDAVVVFAAGNDGCECPSYPGAGDNVVAVSATDSSDKYISFSTYGPWIDVAAPGVEILSLKYGDYYGPYHGSGIHVVADKYYIMSGTSMAAPHVAGLASLILSKHPEFTNDQVVQVIRKSADDIESPGWDIYSGYGRINAAKALQINSVCVAKIIEPHTYDSMSRETSLNIKIFANGTNFRNYVLEYGKGETPSTWTTLTTSSSPITDGYAAKLNLNNLDSGPWTIRLTVYDKQGQTFEDRKVFFVSPSLLSGWPVTLTGVLDTWQSPTIADINSDGYKEVIIGKDSILAYDYLGRIKFNFNDGNDIDVNSLSVAGLYPGNSGKEIAGMLVSGTGPDSDYHYKFNLHFLNQNGKEIDANWPKFLWEYSTNRITTGYLKDGNYWNYIRPTIIADINNDGELEIIQPTDGKIYVFDHTGSLMSGWPVAVGYSKIAVGNIDNDPELEIVGVSDSSIFVLKADGTYSSKWPTKTYSFGMGIYLSDNQPVLADINKDGLGEIIIKIPNDGIYAFKGDGTLAEGSWPVHVAGSYESYPAIADLNKDWNPEIVIFGGEDGNMLYVINHDGTIANGWPKILGATDTTALSPIIGDVDGDGYPEIVAITPLNPAMVNIFRYDGSAYLKWAMGNDNDFSFTSPALGDLDNDGYLELIATTSYFFGDSSKIFAYHLGGIKSGGIASWSMAGSDEKHQNRYVCKGDINGDNKVSLPDLVLFAKAYGSKPGDPKWNLNADLDRNGAVGLTDLVILAHNYGKC